MEERGNGVGETMISRIVSCKIEEEERKKGEEGEEGEELVVR